MQNKLLAVWLHICIMRHMDIKKTRETLGLTQAQLGEKLGLDGSMISKMEGGTLAVGPRTALALEALLARAERGAS